MSEKRTTSEETAIDKLAKWTLSAEPAFRQPLALQQAKLLILDTIGCGLAAKADHGVDDVLEAVGEWGGSPEATIIGGGKAPVTNAVLANGSLVRVLDLNDLQFVEKNGALAVSGHSSDNIPVALAMGEKTGASGLEVLETVIMAYELYDQFHRLMAENSRWDPTTASGLIAAAMAGRLMGLSAVQQANAIALGAVRTAVPKIVRKGEMSAAKSIANAMAAESGVQSALLAAKGVTGPREALEDPEGLTIIFEPERGLDLLWGKPQVLPEILSSHMKDYPCIGTAQTLVTAALELHGKLKGRLDRVEKSDVIMSDVPFVRIQQADRKRADPKTREAADHSFTFLPCVALTDGLMSPHQFENDRWNEPAIRRLMATVALSVSAELRDRAPGSMPCRLEVSLKGGEKLVSECLYPPGHSFREKGLDPEAVKRKFHLVAEPALPKATRDRIVDEAWGLDKASSLAALMSLVEAKAA